MTPNPVSVTDASETLGTANVGQHVIYVDPQGIARDALVTNVFTWPDGGPGSINLVFVEPDDNQTDNYGRKMARSTSVPHERHQSAHGNYWRFWRNQ